MNRPVLNQTPVLGGAISEDQIRQYDEDGVICVRGLFSKAWVERLRAATQRCLDNKAGFAMELATEGDKGRFHNSLFMWRQDPDFRDFVMESPAAAIAKTVMRAKQTRLYFDQLFVKEPGTQTPTPWHHDQPYWPVRGNDVCSIWLTLDPVTRETGGLDYVKGSHRWGKRYNPEEFGSSGMASALGSDENEKIPDIDGRRDEYELLNWDMLPGDCLVFNSLTLHGAAGNSSSSIRRRALSTRWLGDDAVYWPLDKAMPGSPLSPPGLEKGDPMISDAFPVIG